MRDGCLLFSYSQREQSARGLENTARMVGSDCLEGGSIFCRLFRRRRHVFPFLDFPPFLVSSSTIDDTTRLENRLEEKGSTNRARDRARLSRQIQPVEMTCRALSPYSPCELQVRLFRHFAKPKASVSRRDRANNGVR